MPFTQLKIYHADDAKTEIFSSSKADDITSKLHSFDLKFQQWSVNQTMTNDVLADYALPIQRLQSSGQYQTVDVINLTASHPDKDTLRKKFLFEHTHSEDEVRFFVRGHGLFCLHINDYVLQLLCCAGDLINVPKGVKHWFDMGSAPEFTAIRFFNDKLGWIAQATGSDIASHFLLLE